MVAPVPPADRAPPAEGVNLRYAVHPVFPASRSAGSMVKLTPVTLSPIAPDGTVVGLALASAEV